MIEWKQDEEGDWRANVGSFELQAYAIDDDPNRWIATVLMHAADGARWTPYDTKRCDNAERAKTAAEAIYSRLVAPIVAQATHAERERCYGIADAESEQAHAERPKELSARAVLDLIEKRVEEMREGQREVVKTSDERTVIICASGAFEALTKLRLCLDELRGRGDV